MICRNKRLCKRALMKCIFSTCGVQGLFMRSLSNGKKLFLHQEVLFFIEFSVLSEEETQTVYDSDWRGQLWFYLHDCKFCIWSPSYISMSQAVAAAYQAMDEEVMVDSMMVVQLPQKVLSLLGFGDEGANILLPLEVLCDDGTQELKGLHRVQSGRGWILSKVCDHLLCEWSNKSFSLH